jgi:F-type H+-transporting ATPase subunit delta
MNDSKISVRYAKALFQAAMEQNSIDKVMADALTFENAQEMPRFREVLESPVVKTSSKKQIIRKGFETKIDLLFLNFILLVLSNKREAFLPAILRHLKALYKEQQGIKTAELTVSSEIDAMVRKKFSELLSKNFNAKIELEERIDPGIIGGFILKVEDEQYDASVKSELARIRKNLLQTT